MGDGPRATGAGAADSFSNMTAAAYGSAPCNFGNSSSELIVLTNPISGKFGCGEEGG